MFKNVCVCVCGVNKKWANSSSVRFLFFLRPRSIPFRGLSLGGEEEVPAIGGPVDDVEGQEEHRHRDQEEAVHMEIVFAAKVAPSVPTSEASGAEDGPGALGIALAETVVEDLGAGVMFVVCEIVI